MLYHSATPARASSFYMADEQAYFPSLSDMS